MSPTIKLHTTSSMVFFFSLFMHVSGSETWLGEYKSKKGLRNPDVQGDMVHNHPISEEYGPNLFCSPQKSEQSYKLMPGNKSYQMEGDRIGQPRQLTLLEISMDPRQTPRKFTLGKCSLTRRDVSFSSEARVIRAASENLELFTSNLTLLPSSTV